MPLPTQARVIIVGGGIAGCSTAYHLSKLGVTDVLLLEQGKLTCGTTWHAAGLVGQMRPNRNMTQMSQYGIALWAMTRAPVAAVAALRETSVLFAAIIGTVLLKEGFGVARLAGGHARRQRVDRLLRHRAVGDDARARRRRGGAARDFGAVRRRDRHAPAE